MTEPPRKGHVSLEALRRFGKEPSHWPDVHAEVDRSLGLFVSEFSEEDERLLGQMEKLIRWLADARTASAMVARVIILVGATRPDLIPNK